MRIETDIKLDYKDVLLKPKRSTLSSRRSVTIERDFTFRHWNETKEICEKGNLTRACIFP